MPSISRRRLIGTAAAVGLGAVLNRIPSALGATPQVKRDLAADYGGVTQATIARAIADAKAYLARSPNVNYIVQIPAGTWDLTAGPATAATIDVSGVVAGKPGRFILRGAGDTTTLIMPDSLVGVNASNFNRITIASMRMTRPRMKVTQGHVLSVSPGRVVLRIQPGFPDPMSLHSGESGKGAGRYLRRFTDSATDPQLIVDNNNQVGWEDATNVGGNDWAFRQNAGPSPAPYKVGDLIGVKSKHGGDAYKFTNGVGVYFNAVTWLQESRGVFRHVDDVHVGASKILRAPAIQGQVPCLSTPDGGPQVGQPDDNPISGALVENCHFVATGDDGIAFFNAFGEGRGNYIQDAFARGINVYATNGLSPVPKPTLTNNTLVRCAIEDTSYNQR